MGRSNRSIATRIIRIFRVPAPHDGTARDVIRTLRSEFSPYTWQLVIVGVLAAGGALIETLTLAGIVGLASQVAAKEPSGFGFRAGLLDLSLPVELLTIVLLVLVSIRATIVLCEGTLSARLVAKYDQASRLRLYGAFLDSEWSVQSQDKGGLLQELSSTHVAQNRGALSAATQLLAITITIVIMLAAAVTVGGLAATVTLVVMASLLLLLRPLVRRARVYALEMRKIGPQIAHHINETVGLAREIRIFNAAPAMTRNAAEFTERYRFNFARQLLLSRTVPVFTEVGALFIIVIGLGLMYGLGVQNLAPLAVVALLTLRALMYGRSLQALWQLILAAVPFIEGLNIQLALYDANRVQTGNEALRSIETLGLRNTFFSYVRQRLVLDDVTFDVARGDSVGIVGPSGSGKSTVLQLLMRLREPDAGFVVANGRDAREYDLSSWHERIAYVPQEALLLNRSIVENVRFFRSIPVERVRAAARVARIDDEIVAMPDGYETIAGERGNNLSGGQRQRISIARAIAGDPDVVLLDEPTSALDVRSETLIQEALAIANESATLIIVAHRLSTLQACDKIIVLRDGRLQAFGPRREMERTNEYYNEALRLSRLI